MSGSGSDDDDIPAREECEKRCQEFAQITGTDTALAMFYLQDRSWDIQVYVYTGYWFNVHTVLEQFLIFLVIPMFQRSQFSALIHILF